MGNRTSVYLDDSLQAAVKASGVPLAELIRRGLTSNPQPAGKSGTNTSSTLAASPLGDIAPCEPSPGVLCMGPGCLNRSTHRYGLRRMPLCPACAAALQGQQYKRPTPPGAARLARRGAT